MNADQLYESTRTHDNTLSLCQNLNLIPRFKLCLRCNKPIYIKPCSEHAFPFRWRCTRPCSKEVIIRKDTFFKGSKLPIRQIHFFIYFWAYEECSVKKIKRELKWHNQAIVDWKSYLREVCAVRLLQEKCKLGDPGHVVQIDESLFVRRKYNVGRMPFQQWVFCGIDCITKKCFMERVERRDSATLLEIIGRCIERSTTIVSDLWAAYATVGTQEYIRLTVNYSFNYIDPITYANTQRVENMWGRAKKRNKRENGTRHELLYVFTGVYVERTVSWRRV